MKKLQILLLIVYIPLASFAQSLLPEIVSDPLSGFSKIVDEYPFVISQSRNTNGSWNNLTRYTWIPATVPGYKSEKIFAQFINEEWITSILEHNAFTTDEQERITSVINEKNLTYGGSSSTEKYQYNYYYDTNGTITHINVKQALEPTFSSFFDHSTINYTYDTTGVLTKDSSYNYNSMQSNIRLYQYDENGNPTKYIEIASSTLDTLNITHYSFINNRLRSIYAQARNPNADILEPTKTDSFEYDINGNMIRRISYGVMYVGGQPIPFKPLRNETYLFNNENQMITLERKSYDENINEWKPTTKGLLSYANSKLSLIHWYNWNNTIADYDSIPNIRTIFETPTALDENNDLEQYLDATLYPNPAHGIVMLKLAPSVLQTATYVLYNTQGQLTSVPITVTNDNAIFDISNLPRGIYAVQIRSGRNQIIQKLIVN